MRLLSKLCSLTFFVCLTFKAFSQVAIGTGANAPNPDTNAVLLLEGNGSQGIIIPKVSSLGTFGKPGMIVYNTSTGTVHYFNTAWVQVGSGGSGTQGIQISGNKVLIGTGAGFSTEFSIANTAPGANGQILMWDSSLNSGAGGWTSSAANAPSAVGQVLKWNGSRWEPGTDNTGSTTTLSGDVSGPSNNSTISLTAGNSIAAALNNAATTSKILPAQISAGTAGQVLTTTGGVAVWSAPTGGSLPSLSANQLLSNNGINTAINVAGDIGLSVSGTTGTFTVANNAITTAKINNGAVTVAKIGTAGLPDANRVLTTDASGVPQWTVAAGGGDMFKSTYDPTNINGSAFNLSNHTGQVGATQIADASITGGTAGAGVKIAANTITDANISSSAAIIGTKINPAFGAQNITTTTGSASIGGGLNVGLANQFSINNAGNITKINGATTSFPATNAVGVLTNDGAGSLTWAPAGGGTVTTVSVVGANGFNGSVANATSTPAITIGTSLTGILKGTGTGISSAAAGTDYQAPITLTTTGTSGAATLVGNTLNVPNYSSTAYLAGTGLTLTTNTFSVNTSQNISTLSNLTTNGLIKTSGGTGALSIATAGTDYLTPTGNGSGLTSLNASNISSGTLPVAQVPNLDASKITTGTFGSAQITDGTIADADVNASAAIAGSKINPNFGTQNIVTTGTLTSGTAGAFGIDATGNITKIRNVTTSFPAANAAGVLTNDGTGTLTWAAGSGWGLTGTAGTVDGTNFIGTSDNIPFTIRVNNQQAMRISFTNATSAPNILAGYSGNTITNGVIGSAILSGGFNGQINQVTDNYSVIGGGSLNRAGDNDADPSNAGAATVSGGNLNKATSSFATVGGGYNNQASGNSAVVAGGRNATASGEAAGVLSGEVNVASGFRSAVVGGNANTASGANSFVGGGEFNGGPGAFSAVSGGRNNTASGQMTSIPGGQGLFARAFGETAVGIFNIDYTPASTTGFDANDRLFVIGNGTSLASRSNALTVLKNGNVGIGNTNPTEKLDITGNLKFSGALMPNNLPGTAGQVLTSAGPGLPPTWSAAGSGWALGGNNGTVDGAIGTGTNYVGTKDNVPLNFIVNNQRAGRIEASSANANTMYGFQSGNVNTGIRNAGFGYQALLNNAAGQRNAAFGYQALTSNTTGNGNTAVGSTALSLNTTGGANAAFGTAALTNNTASNNTAVGNSALNENTTASDNTAVGTQSLAFNTIGASNSALGSGSLISNTTGSNNTAVGTASLGNNLTGSGNTALGFNAEVATGALTNATAIGANASVTTSNTIQLGDVNVTTVNVGTGTTAKLVAGQLQITGGTLGAGRVLTSDALGNATWQPATGGGWSLSGNALVGGEKLGSSSAFPLTFMTNNTDRMTISSTGVVGINNTNPVAGTFGPAVKLDVRGSIRAATDGVFAEEGGQLVLGEPSLAPGGGIGNWNVDAYFSTDFNKFRIFNDRTGNNAFHVTDNGTPLVGIGNFGFNESALATLDVKGNIKITDGTQGVGKVLTSDDSGFATWQPGGGGGWGLTGNAGTVDGTNFIGTTDNIPFTIRVNNQPAGRIESATPFATFYGYQAGLNNGAAQNNTAVGYQALSSTTSAGNTAFGYQAMQNSNGGQNVAMGDRALQTNTNGSLNTAIGWGALSNPTSTANNTAIGGGAMQQATGGQNVAVGTFSAAFNSTGATNVFVGYQAGYPNASVSQANTTGSNNTFIGANTGLSNSTQRTNSTAIGANATVNADNSLILGSINGVNGATATVNVGIGTSAPTNRLHINEPSTAGNFLRITNNPSPNGLSIGLSGAGSQEAFIANNENAAMYFQTNAANRMTITAAGNVGIGTISPNATLQLGNVLGNRRLVLWESANNDHEFYGFGISGGEFRYQIPNNAGAQHRFFAATSATTSLLQMSIGANGNVAIAGSLSKGSGTFKIDHPQDPENKYLYHSFVESPDMMNVYNGNITTNVDGSATVELPAYFESLNKDFRYQLTVIGAFAQAIIATEVKDNKFVIKTDKPNVKVSWQVTGIRKDPYAEQNRVVPEVEKPANEKGKFLHPEAYGLPLDRSVNHVSDKKENN